MSGKGKGKGGASAFELPLLDHDYDTRPVSPDESGGDGSHSLELLYYTDNRGRSHPSPPRNKKRSKNRRMASSGEGGGPSDFTLPEYSPIPHNSSVDLGDSRPLGPSGPYSNYILSLKQLISGGEYNRKKDIVHCLVEKCLQNRSSEAEEEKERVWNALTKTVSNTLEDKEAEEIKYTIAEWHEIFKEITQQSSSDSSATSSPDEGPIDPCLEIIKNAHKRLLGYLFFSKLKDGRDVISSINELRDIYPELDSFKDTDHKTDFFYSAQLFWSGFLDDNELVEGSTGARKLWVGMTENESNRTMAESLAYYADLCCANPETNIDEDIREIDRKPFKHLSKQVDNILSACNKSPVKGNYKVLESSLAANDKNQCSHINFYSNLYQLHDMGRRKQHLKNKYQHVQELNRLMTLTFDKIVASDYGSGGISEPDNELANTPIEFLRLCIEKRKKDSDKPVANKYFFNDIALAIAIWLGPENRKDLSNMAGATSIDPTNTLEDKDYSGALLLDKAASCNVDRAVQMLLAVDMIKDLLQAIQFYGEIHDTCRNGEGYNPGTTLTAMNNFLDTEKYESPPWLDDLRGLYEKIRLLNDEEFFSNTSFSGINRDQIDRYKEKQAQLIELVNDNITNSNNSALLGFNRGIQIELSEQSGPKLASECEQLLHPILIDFFKSMNSADSDCISEIDRYKEGQEREVIAYIKQWTDKQSEPSTREKVLIIRQIIKMMDYYHTVCDLCNSYGYFIRDGARSYLDVLMEMTNKISMLMICRFFSGEGLDHILIDVTQGTKASDHANSETQICCLGSTRTSTQQQESNNGHTENESSIAITRTEQLSNTSHTMDQGNRESQFSVQEPQSDSEETISWFFNHVNHEAMVSYSRDNEHIDTTARNDSTLTSRDLSRSRNLNRPAARFVNGIKLTYESPAFPPELLSFLLNSNFTDGVFNIYGVDGYLGMIAICYQATAHAINDDLTMNNQNIIEATESEIINLLNSEKGRSRAEIMIRSREILINILTLQISQIDIADYKYFNNRCEVLLLVFLRSYYRPPSIENNFPKEMKNPMDILIYMMHRDTLSQQDSSRFRHTANDIPMTSLVTKHSRHRFFLGPEFNTQYIQTFNFLSKISQVLFPCITIKLRQPYNLQSNEGCQTLTTVYDTASSDSSLRENDMSNDFIKICDFLLNTIGVEDILLQNKVDRFMSGLSFFSRYCLLPKDICTREINKKISSLSENEANSRLLQAIAARHHQKNYSKCYGNLSNNQLYVIFIMLMVIITVILDHFYGHGTSYGPPTPTPQPDCSKICFSPRTVTVGEKQQVCGSELSVTTLGKFTINYDGRSLSAWANVSFGEVQFNFGLTSTPDEPFTFAPRSPWHNTTGGLCQQIPTEIQLNRSLENRFALMVDGNEVLLTGDNITNFDPYGLYPTINLFLHMKQQQLRGSGEKWITPSGWYRVKDEHGKLRTDAWQIGINVVDLASYDEIATISTEGREQRLSTSTLFAQPPGDSSQNNTMENTGGNQPNYSA